MLSLFPSTNSETQQTDSCYTGADINIIKANALLCDMLVYQDNKVEIQSITEKKQHTLGIAYLNSFENAEDFEKQTITIPNNKVYSLEQNNLITVPAGACAHV